jgi:hypothetical protein
MTKFVRTSSRKDFDHLPQWKKGYEFDGMIDEEFVIEITPDGSTRTHMAECVKEIK